MTTTDTPRPAGREHFPPTQRPWIEEHLAEGDAGRLAVGRHVMAVYAEPLEVYLRGTPWRTLGDPADLVGGFFADRLSQPSFLVRWSASGRSLRRWLCTALRFYLQERAREQERGQGASLELDRLPGAGPSPEEACDRAFAVSVVRAALSEAARDLGERGLSAHYDCFFEHHVLDRPHAEIARRTGLSTDRVRVMARTGRQAFRRALRTHLERDGCRPGEVDRAIDELIGVME